MAQRLSAAPGRLGAVPDRKGQRMRSQERGGPRSDPAKPSFEPTEVLDDEAVSV